MRKQYVTLIIIALLAASLTGSIFLAAIAYHIYGSWIPFLSLGCMLMATLMPTLCSDPNHDAMFGNPFDESDFFAEMENLGYFLMAGLMVSAFAGPLVVIHNKMAPLDIVYFTAPSSMLAGIVMCIVLKVIH